MYEHVVLLSVWKEFGVLTCHMPHNLQKPQEQHIRAEYSSDTFTHGYLIMIQPHPATSCQFNAANAFLRLCWAALSGSGGQPQHLGVVLRHKILLSAPCCIHVQPCFWSPKNSASSWKRLLQALKIKHTKDIPKLNGALVCSATFYNKCELQDGDLARGWRPAPFWEHVQTQQMWCGKTRKTIFQPE